MKLFLYDFVGGFESDEILQSVKTPENNDDIELHINSVGGEVFQGFAIYSRLKALPNKVNVYIDGLAGSIASVIAMAGDTINISEAGSIMIHSAKSMMGGNAEDLEKQVDQLKAIDKVITKIYANRTGLKLSKIKELMEAETVMMSGMAIKLGFADKLMKPIKAVAEIDLNKMDIKEKIKGLASMVFGDNLETDELKEIQNKLEKKTAEETAALIQKKEGKDALFAEYISAKEFINFKNQVVEFIGTMVEYVEDQPNGDEIMDSIKENTNSELFKLLTDIKTNNKIPAAKEHKEMADLATKGFNLEQARQMHITNKKNNN